MHHQPLQKKNGASSSDDHGKQQKGGLRLPAVPVLQNEPDKPHQLVSDNNPQAQRPNNTGLPDNLKAGIENLSGFTMDDVEVHYNSDKPAQLQALAYAQGTDIHVAPGQERHLPHEAWHVVQQKQGRVNVTTQLKNIDINNDSTLETEADVMGDRARRTNKATFEQSKQTKPIQQFSSQREMNSSPKQNSASINSSVIQGKWTSEFTTQEIPDDKWLVALVNENTSIHGHTDLIIQGKSDTGTWYQSLSYQPQDKIKSTQTLEERDLSLTEKVTGRRNSVGELTPGRVISLTHFGSTNSNIPGAIAKNNTAIIISIDQGRRLQELIERDKNDPPPYATIGHPMNLLERVTQQGKRKPQNCHTWAVSILTEAGISVPSIPYYNIAPKSAEGVQGLVEPVKNAVSNSANTIHKFLFGE